MLSPPLVIAQFTLLQVRRVHFYPLLLLILLIGVASAEFLGAIALTDLVSIQVGFTSVLLRLTSLVLLAVVVLTTTRDELGDEGRFMVLAAPLSRLQFYLGKLLVVIWLALLLAVAMSALLALYGAAMGLFYWGCGLFLELLLMGLLALLLAFGVQSHALALLALVAIYLAGRWIDIVVGIAGGAFFDGSLADRFLLGFVSLLAYLLPPFSELARAEWLLAEAATGALLLSLLKGLLYGLLLALVTLFDLYRRSF